MYNEITTSALNNDLFTIKGINNNIVDIMYIDYQNSIFNASNISNTALTYSMKVLKKTFNLDKKISIELRNIDYLKKLLNDEFIKKITKLGRKNREDTLFDYNKLDILIKNINIPYGMQKEEFISNTIYQKFYSIQYALASKCFMQEQSIFVISNYKTYTYILKNINIASYDNTLSIGNMTYTINNSVEDDILLFGIKNSIEYPGVHCLIQTNNTDHINFLELNSPYYKSIYEIHYNIIELGSKVETQYLVINTRDIAYHRNKKLQKIKEIYEK